MKPHPRIRKTIKWGGAAATLVLVFIWGLSVFCNCFYRMASKRTFILARGQVALGDDSSPNLSGAGWHLYPHPPACSWFGGKTDTGKFHCRWLVFWSDDGSTVGLYIWPLSLVLAVPTAIAWRLDTLARRRARGGVNLCPKCTYDRTGLAADAKCPECGTLPKP